MQVGVWLRHWANQIRRCFVAVCCYGYVNGCRLYVVMRVRTWARTLAWQHLCQGACEVEVDGEAGEMSVQMWWP